MKKVFSCFQDMSLGCLQLCLREPEVTEITQSTFLAFINFWFQFSMCDFNLSPKHL